MGFSFKRFFLSIFILLPFTGVFSNNNLPKLNCYDKNDYQAGRQNWDIDIDSDGVVYFCNSDGLLYNIYGEWRLQSMSTKGFVRSVMVDNDTIWSGGKEFGYFTKAIDGLDFHSLGELEHEQIWDIISFENTIVYLSETRVIYYDKTDKSTKIYKFRPGVWSIAKWRGKIWSVHKNGEIGYLEKGIFKKKTLLKELQSVEVRKIFVHNNQLYIVTLEGKLYSFDGEKIAEVVLPKVLKGKALFSGMSFDKTSFCLATISEGFVRISDKGEVLNLVNSKNGLLDNTVLSMTKDRLGNMWLGLDYGLAKVELQGPINQIFNGAATYGIKNYHGTTYIATNKGLYHSLGNDGFELMESSGGQIWSLRVIDDVLYSCNNNGLSKIEDNKIVETTINYTGIYDFVNFEGTDFYIFSTYQGLQLIKKTGENFKYIKNLELWGNKKLNYDKENNCVWGEFVNESVYQFTLTADFEIEKKEYSNFAKVFDTGNGIFFSDNKNLYEYNDGKFQLVKHTLLKTINGPVQAIAYDQKGYLCYVQDRELKLSVLLPDASVHSYSTLLTSLGNNVVLDFEFLDFDGHLLRLATDRGVTTFDINYQSDLEKYSSPVISSFTVFGEKNITYHLPYPEEGVYLGAGNKDMRFRFGINKSDYDVVEYRYKLPPNQNNWSEWSSKNEILITQVNGGEHTFYLQSRVNGGAVDGVSLKFSIEKFWYQTSWVILPIFFIAFLWIFGVIIVMTRINRRKLNRQKKLYVERDTHRILELKNNQLLQFAEIISRKNEFLNKVKTGLEGMRNRESSRWARLISNEVNNEKKDFLFHKLFSEVHQEFISHLTENYPSLTSNDIRVLSFIRINLDKNEICNLMNISPRSLDTNRYRLRKKLNLEQGVDLNQFIRDF